MPAGRRNGSTRDSISYPHIYPGEDLKAFNFFEASSIRKIGNKYVTIYSGYSGREYGLGMTNSTLRYAYGDRHWVHGRVVVFWLIHVHRC